MSEQRWDYWWSLPGPSSCVRAVVEDLRNGTNVVMAFPQWAPPGLQEVIGRSMRDDELLRWRPLSVQPPQEIDPLHIIGHRYATDVPTQALYDEGTLVDSRAFADCVVWVEGIEETAWPSWRGFLERYADLARRRSALERGVLCVQLIGQPPEQLPKSDVALTVYRWQDYVGELDMLAWLHYLMGHQSVRSPIKRQLKLRLALELVGYDPNLAIEAADLPLEALTDPVAWLRTIAVTRDWSEHMSPCWQAGSHNVIDGRPVTHPALRAVRQHGLAEIHSLVWRAQVAVLFPYLEEARAHYLREYADSLRLPHDTGYGLMIHHREDLELSHIHHQLRHRVPQKEQQRLRLLRDVRNALAHHQALNAQFLQEIVRLDFTG